MSNRLIMLLAAAAGLGVLSALALADVGYFGIIKPHFLSWGGAQVFADLSVLAIMACVWMVRDAPAHGLSAWPFIGITIVAGSFGPLLYLVARELKTAHA